MAVTFLDVFDDLARDLVVDAHLVKRIARYKNAFIQKNESHIAFFGGNLLGTEVVRHVPADRQQFFEDVLGIDEYDARKGVSSVSVVEDDYARLSDPYNSASIYLLYRLVNNSRLPEKLKQEAMHDVAFMLQVKYFTSLLSHWFRHQAQLNEAKATYAALSLRFGLKETGSWKAWFDLRASDFISPDSIHYSAIKTFKPDAGKRSVSYAVTEPQDRLRATMKKMYKVFMEVRRSGSKISSTSATLEIDGELLIKSQTSNSRRYLDYIKGVILDKNTFVRSEVFEVTTKVVHTVSPRLFSQLLAYVSDNYNRGKAVPVEPMIDELVLHAIQYIAENRISIEKTNDLGNLVSRLKSLYTASLMSDQGLLKARACADKIVNTARLSKNKSMNASLRTSLEIYIVLRTLSMNYYK